ncbi:Curli production assembly/transport component CsgG (plasmid) [Gemmatirosa kalamazoonensis]|uniref:Curli production assembly/transport component CsgG n=1 Tax=Gemmatirosa kalamazoonensis TaxID=861299 RepID=W0RQP7_9BACT|nr:Curli production assembly/transport component CsgG [Gemmatirosa kalamazoonensis]
MPLLSVFPPRRRLVCAIATLLSGACASGAGSPPAGPPVPTRAPVIDPATGAVAVDSSAGRAGARTIGVPPFALTDSSPGGTLSPLAFALADLLTTDLARSRRVTVVERARLGDVLRELDLVSAGRVDSSSAPRVGRLIQARRLVMGRLTALPAGRDLRLGVQLADVAQGTLADAVDATAQLTDVLEAEKALALRLFDALGITLAPDERAAVESRPTANLTALLSYGRGVRLQYLGDLRGAESEFRRAAREAPGFTDARVRAGEVRRVSESGVASPVLVPGIRAVDAAIGVTIDRLNRPLDFITTATTGATSRTTDPTFATSTATVVITVNRP